MRSPLPHAWSWIQAGLHVLMAGLLAMVVVEAIGEDGQHEWSVISTGGAICLVYLVGLVPTVRDSPQRSLGWLVVLIGLWLALLLLSPQALFLAFPLYFLCAHLLPDRWAVGGVLLIAVLGILGYSTHREFSPAIAIGPALGALVALGTVLGLRAVDRESARRGVLEERERLAREIHDTLAQGFVSINLLLGAAAARLPGCSAADQAELAKLIDQARDVAVANLTEARRFVNALAPSPSTQTALVETMRRTVAEMGSATFQVDGVPWEVSSAREVALLRIAREALTNAQRYADAERVAVTLSWLADVVVLDVVDNGSGFDVSQRYRGFGLHSMRSRAEELGGTFTIESTRGQGTAVSVVLPREERR